MDSALFEEKSEIDEIIAEEKLYEFRKEQDGFLGNSFPTISGAESNSAIIHYRAKKETCRKLKQGVLDVVSEIVQQFLDSPPAGEGRPGENQGTSSEQPLEDLAKAYGADKNSADEDRETNGLVTGIEDKAKGFISRLNGEDQDPKDKPFAEDLISSLRAYAGSYDDDSSIRAQRGIASALESILYVREATDSIDKIRKIFEEVKQFVEPASESLQADRHKREGSLAQRQTLTKIFTDAL